MDRATQRKKLVEGNRGGTAFMKLLGQIAILDERVMVHVCLARGARGHRQLSEMVLDTETFYTVAGDSLKLASLFLAPSDQNRFVADLRYKTIQRIRSEYRNVAAPGEWSATRRKLTVYED
jgi:hypothetical protein